ncbi:MAG TPA: acyl-CoA thioesterase [Chitinophagaceae bacterium]|nr:acyl-CoA thioesterase [Chitinophagaceae bacterium]
MEKFQLPIQVRWSDFDPNFHLRHSVYYDWAALSRVTFLYSHGFTTELMTKLNFGPILLREEAIFKKEIRPQDEVTVGLELLKSRRDFSRWTIRHPIMKSGDTLSAILTVDGAWIDTVKRKLTIPPSEGAEAFNKMGKADEFTWSD